MTERTKQKKLKTVGAVVLGIIAVVFGGPPVVDALLTDTNTYHITAQQRLGAPIHVDVAMHEKGFFIDGGHAWSIGSIHESYDLRFTHADQKLKWSGPGVPVILQAEGPHVYLATYNRETHPTRSTLDCFMWNGEWRPLPQTEFPKHLAVFNLVHPGPGNGVSELGTPDFRRSLLAKFWYCMAYDTPCWEVEDSMIEDAFIADFHRKWIQRK